MVYNELMDGFLRSLRLFLSGIIMMLALDGRVEVLAAEGAAFDSNYRYNSPPQGAQAAPVDNDQYYTPPSDYIDKFYSMPNHAYPPATGSSYKGCATIGDSPSCMGD